MITLEQATVGSIVLLKNQQGIIIGASTINPNFVVLEFSNGYCNSYNLDILDLFDPIEQENKRIEEELKNLKEEVNNKLRTASLLLQQADTLVKANNKTLKDIDKTDPQKFDFDTTSLIETITSIGLTDAAAVKLG